MISELEASLIKNSEEMIRLGEQVLADPMTPNYLKKLVKKEMVNQQKCMETMKNIFNLKEEGDE